ncbi:LysR family transcriptional regulator [Ottowia sp. VDI28]
MSVTGKSPPGLRENWYLRGRLRLRHLKLVVDLEETHHVGETARRLATTQPAVSKMLAELEALMGAALFTRTPKGTFATPYGQTLIRHARWILGDLDRLGADCMAEADAGRERVVLGTNSSSAAFLVPQALLALRKRAAEVSLVVREGSLETLMPQLQTRQIDLVVARLEDFSAHSELICIPLRQEPMCVVTSCSHPLAGRKKCTWAHLTQYPWILPPSGSPVRKALDLLIRREGIPVDSYIESASAMTNLMLMDHSDHLSILPMGIARYHEARGALAILPVRLADIFAPLGVLRHSRLELSVGMQQVIDALMEVAQSSGPS